MKDELSELVQGLFEYGIVSVNTQQPFVLASGRTSPVYFDHRRLFSVPKLRTLALRAWACALEIAFPKLSSPDGQGVVIVGTATAGIAPAFALAQLMQKRFAYVRSQSKAHGMGRMVEGVWKEGDTCLVVDDMITTGKSVLEAVARLRQECGIVMGVTSFNSHPFASTEARFAEAAVPFFSLHKSDELLGMATELGLITEAELQIVLRWYAQQS